MRQSLKLALILIPVAHFGLVACDHGRNYDPQHRLKSPAAQGSPAGPAQPSTGKSTAASDAALPETLIDSKAAVADRAWCVIRPKNFAVFFVDRFVFSGDEKQSTLHERLVFIPGQAPVVREAKEYGSWTDVTGQTPETAPEVGLTALTSEQARRHPDAGDQIIAFRDFLNVNPVEVSPEGIGANGAVTLNVRGQKSLMLFDCQDFSPSFVSLKKQEPAPAKPAAPAAAQPAPVAPDAELQMVVGAFTGPLKKVDVTPASLQNSRWCSFKKSLDDTIVGTLEFGANKDIVLNHFKASMLKMDAATRKDFRRAKSADTLTVSGLRTKENLVSAPPLRFRSVIDGKGKRALIFDTLNGEAYPSSTAETFFECSAENDTMGEAKVLANLISFMNSSKR